jgi:ribosomal protein S18 acetylase RimI-like enzyme
MPRTLSVRPVRDSDEPFLREVYASTRIEEFSVVKWTTPELEAFLRMQFDAQHRHYQTLYPDAQYSVVLLEGLPVGRLYLHRSPSAFRIIDIALLPPYRGRGFGSALISEVLAEAARVKKPVLIHVERTNPALRLYRRLEFRPVQEGPVYILMSTDPQV